MRGGKRHGSVKGEEAWLSEGEEAWLNEGGVDTLPQPRQLIFCQGEVMVRIRIACSTCMGHYPVIPYIFL